MAGPNRLVPLAGTKYGVKCQNLEHTHHLSYRHRTVPRICLTIHDGLLRRSLLSIETDAPPDILLTAFSQACHTWTGTLNTPRRLFKVNSGRTKKYSVQCTHTTGRDSRPR